MPCWIFDIGRTVLAEWRFAFSGAGLSFPGLKDYKLIPAQNLRSIQAEEYSTNKGSKSRKRAYVKYGLSTSAGRPDPRLGKCCRIQCLKEKIQHFGRTQVNVKTALHSTKAGETKNFL